MKTRAMLPWSVVLSLTVIVVAGAPLTAGAAGAAGATATAAGSGAGAAPLACQAQPGLYASLLAPVPSAEPLFNDVCLDNQCSDAACAGKTINSVCGEGERCIPRQCASSPVTGHGCFCGPIG